MIESYNKVSMSDEKIFSRFNELLTPEFLKAKQNLQDKLEQLNSIIKYVDEYEGEESRLIDVKRYSNKIFETYEDNPEKEVEYQFFEFYQKFLQRAQTQNDKDSIDKFQKKYLELKNYTRVEVLRKITGADQKELRKQFGKWQNGANSIPQKIIKNTAIYFKINADYIRFGNPEDYLDTVFNSDFLTPTFSPFEIKEIFKKMDKSQQFYQKQESEPTFKKYPDKKKVLHFAFKNEILYPLKITTDIYEYIKIYGKNNFYLYINYVLLAEDKDYTSKYKLIKLMTPLLNNMINELASKIAMPKDVYQLFDSQIIPQIYKKHEKRQKVTILKIIPTIIKKLKTLEISELSDKPIPDNINAEFQKVIKEEFYEKYPN
ncbi:hypothetical protein [Lactococcus petauri]|uniref:hypothetical protein n=1 Tax=Lactococcus petauri TaxID=1940789 RepID=UPI0022E6B327|nr:hypothetical protein [Lactococcus petauri]